MSKAIYPGSFDPVTFGHLDIIERAYKLFDELIVVVLNNSKKNPLFSTTERVKILKGIFKERHLDIKVDTNDGLLVDYAKMNDAKVVIRGLRAITDFDYELQIAQVNKLQLSGLETVFLATSLEYSYLSSSIVKEFASYGGDISGFVPKSVIPLVESKFK